MSKQVTETRDSLGGHDHAEQLAWLNAGATSARKHGRPSTAARKQQEADRLDHHIREFHQTWVEARGHSH